MQISRDEKLKLLECATILVQAGLMEPAALDGFKLAHSARVDPIAALSGVYDGIVNLYISKLALGEAEKAP